jgi:DNA damage-binding protein 1
VGGGEEAGEAPGSGGGEGTPGKMTGRKRSRPAASASAAAAAAGAPGGGSAPRTPTPRLVFGAISGALGVIISLPPATHALLQAAQESMGRVVQGVGGLSHAAWRAFFTEQRPPAYLSGGPGAASAGIIDGDFLELLLDMEGGLQEAVVADMNGGSAGSAGACTVSHLLGVIEHLASLH